MSTPKPAAPRYAALTVSEFAQRLGIGRTAAYRLMKQGAVKYAQLPGGHRRIPESEVDRLLTPKVAP